MRRNPSSWLHRLIVALIALTAAGIALYLGLYQIGSISSVWDPLFGASSSETVLHSSLSRFVRHISGLPDALWGALAYGADVVLAFLGSGARWRTRPWLVLLYGLNALLLLCTGFVLVSWQIIIIQTLCFLCIASAALSLIIVAIAQREVIFCIRYLFFVWQRDRKALTAALMGRRNPAAERTAREIAQNQEGEI